MTRRANSNRVRKFGYEGKYDMGRVLELRQLGFGYKRIAEEIGASRDVARELVQRLERMLAAANEE